MDKTAIITLSHEVVVTKIFLITNMKVMLNRDLANLYNVKTRDLNKAVNCYIKRFPEDFMFLLTKDEFKNLMFQIGILGWGGTHKNLFAFNEQGLAMYFCVLNSD